MNTRIAGWLGCLVMITAVGCDTVRAPGAATPDPLHSEDYPNIALLDGLDQWMAYDTPIVNDRGDQPMQVSVPVRLLSRGQAQELDVQYRFIFYDERGAELSNQAGWQHRRMPARAQVQLQATARSNAAEDWRLEIRPAR